MMKNQKSKRGFSLIEFAIVIGVGSIIAGAIWAVADNAWEATRREQMKEELAHTVGYIRSRYAGQEGVPRIGSAPITSQIITNGILPQNMISRGGDCKNPLGQCGETVWGSDALDPNVSTNWGSYRICDWTMVPAQNDCDLSPVPTNTFAQYFGVGMYSLSFANCLWIATNLSSDLVAKGLVRVHIQNAAALTTFPIPLANARAACAVAPALKSVRFVYRLRTPTG